MTANGMITMRANVECYMCLLFLRCFLWEKGSRVSSMCSDLPWNQSHRFPYELECKLSFCLRLKVDLAGDVAWSMVLFQVVFLSLYFDPITCDVFRIKREREEGKVKYSGFLHAINCFLSGKCKSTWHEQIDGVALTGCAFIWGWGKVLRVDIDGEGFNAKGMAVNTVNRWKAKLTKLFAMKDWRNCLFTAKIILFSL